MSEKYDLVKHIERQKRWSEMAFGPIKSVDRTNGVLDHMTKEIEEVRKNPKDTEEWIDLMMLSIDGAWRNGATPEEIAYTLEMKLKKNMRREWPDWREADPEKAIEHVKETRNL